MKRSNHKNGIFAEYVALLWLTLKGYRLVTMRYKTKLGEIDLIVRRGQTLVFAEVKARANMEDAAAAIHTRNQARVMQAAQLFLRNHPGYVDYQVRFDAVLVTWYKRPQHLAHAFSAH